MWVHNDCFLDKPKQKVNTTQPGDIVRTPDSHPDDFVKLRGVKNIRIKIQMKFGRKAEPVTQIKMVNGKLDLMGEIPLIRKRLL